MSNTNMTHTSLFTLLRFTVSTCFGHYLPILRRHYTKLYEIIQYSGVDKATSLESHVVKSLTYKILKFLVGSFGLDSLVLPVGSILDTSYEIR
jgi:hypothetical protein